MGFLDRIRIGWRAIKLYKEGRIEEANLLLTELQDPEKEKKGII